MNKSWIFKLYLLIEFFNFKIVFSILLIPLYYGLITSSNGLFYGEYGGYGGNYCGGYTYP